MTDVAAREAAVASLPNENPGAPVGSPTRQVDVAIVGGGLSGSLAAVVLGRAGYRVALIDRYAVFPAQFRVEKFTGYTIEALGRLGLLDVLAAAATPFDQVVNARRGQIIDRSEGAHYGILYKDIVRTLRAQLPASVEFLVDRVADIETGPDLQRVELAGGEVLEARLVVLATGMGDILREKIGIARRVTFEKHSISFGFSISPAPGQAFDFPALTYYGETVADRVDYLNVFPVGEVMRANLFTFRDQGDPWVGELIRAPKATLLATLPGLSRFLGDFQMASPVQAWVMDLSAIENHEQDGVVVVGDAFQSSCPAAGAGVPRLMADVERLCTAHLPRWFQTAGMGREKIAEFYQDTGKQASDRRALKSSRYRRTLTIDTSVLGTAHRLRAFAPRRPLAWLRDLRR
ncbi:FAD-dependent monooxygenase [Phenylobacterium hankyongense]|uniref:FAD-dependent monooxygenase n=2 Tax=Phenylobacterium hankyongense TaxID=1813876 RepID=A0A328B069_9CAUL|nr:FAD-dependent monooxygenase [Phenylobacterium hankyongense]